MSNFKILGFFVLLSLTLTLQINSQLSHALKSGVAQDALRAWVNLKALKPHIVQGKLSTTQLKNLEAVLVESLNLVRQSIKQKAAEESKHKPADKTITTSTPSKTPKIDNKLSTGSKLPPADTKTSKTENKPKVDNKTPKTENKPKVDSHPINKTPKTENKPKVDSHPINKTPKTDNKPSTGSKLPPADTKTSKTENKPKVDNKTPKTENKPKVDSHPINKTPKTENKPKVDSHPITKPSSSSSSKISTVDHKQKNTEPKTKPEEKKPIVHPSFVKDQPKKVDIEDDSSSEESTPKQKNTEPETKPEEQEPIVSPPFAKDQPKKVDIEDDSSSEEQKN